ncbi:uncharacterized protein BDZ99DRAFT_565440 [Mytilinidion resinicola]|uniref:Uncharacterized protein n=1 Tax=Mytilinidion resinicola TaxID=574789 RepID=A0A6A6ZAL0_9PEZI|nr:uncharacterized protein BDZ99DRAFT_565440 [Mytilinidion resinicola]KAF2817739.1 hypothetical protein BDZ99DRAFT_565440 [Mytilinidion resinicola]
MPACAGRGTTTQLQTHSNSVDAGRHYGFQKLEFKEHIYRSQEVAAALPVTPATQAAVTQGQRNSTPNRCSDTRARAEGALEPEKYAKQTLGAQLCLLAYTVEGETGARLPSAYSSACAANGTTSYECMPQTSSIAPRNSGAAEHFLYRHVRSQ